MFSEQSRADSPKYESNDDKMEHDFVRFIDTENVRGEELRTAYLSACGVIQENTSSDTRSEMILRKVSEMVEAGFPLNRFVIMIKGLEGWEDSVPLCRRYIDELKITENEKMVLNSLIDRDREGTLEIIDNGIVIGKLQISHAPSIVHRAYALHSHLLDIIGTTRGLDRERVSFQFEEK